MAGYSVFGIYTSRQTIETAVQELKAAAFRSSDISILAPENLGDVRDIATVKSTKAPEGATTGGVSGAVLFAVIGWFLGSGALSGHVPGQLLAAGPVIVALAGFGVGAALGGLIGAIIGFGKPEFEARRYGARLKNGGILLSVHADNQEWISRAKVILEKTGAKQVASAGESRVA